MNMTPKNIKVKFGKYTVTLKDENDRRKTPAGVEIYLQKRQSDYRAWASIPDGTLDEYKHYQPVIVGVDWVENDA